MSSVIIGVGHGLGDRLLMSTIPSKLTALGHEAWFSCPDSPSLPPNKRNSEAEGILLSIPGLAGLTDKPATAWPRKPIRDLWTLSCIHRNEFSYFGETHSNGLPSIGYTPKNLPTWNETIVADLTGYKHYTDVIYNDFLDMMSEVYGVPRSEIVAVVPKYPGVHGSAEEYLPANRSHHVSSIYEYLDIMHSARARLVTDSGSQHLCAAIAAPANVLIDNLAYHSASVIHGTLHRYWPSGAPTRDVQLALQLGHVTVRPLVYWQR